MPNYRFECQRCGLASRMYADMKDSAEVSRLTLTCPDCGTATQKRVYGRGVSTNLAMLHAADGQSWSEQIKNTVESSRARGLEPVQVEKGSWT